MGDIEACLTGLMLEGTSGSGTREDFLSINSSLWTPINDSSLFNASKEANYTYSSGLHMPRDKVLEDMKMYLRIIVNPALCVFGVIGNILNIIVLTRRRLQAGMDSMEQAAHINLVALAVSDLLYCLFALPKSFQHGEQYIYTRRNFWVYYSMYGACFQNIFSKTSTWLTVVMAIGRYAAICHPLRAREYIHVTVTRSAIVATFVVWFLLHLPQFWNYTLDSVPCVDGGSLYAIGLGEFEKNRKLNMGFSYTWAILGFFIPVPLLAYCNVCLIRALRESTQLRRQYRVHDKRKSRPGSRITPTFILIVIMYLVLVTPSEIISFLQEHLTRDHTEGLLASMELANSLHTVNFSSNFVLYCSINVHFRKTLRDIFFAILCRKPKRHIRATSWTRQSSKSFTTNLSETPM